MSQKDERTDLRVQRTHKLLRDAFSDLVVEKGFVAITVQDITERAMVNRSTFYRHYLDKYDLATRMFQEVLDELDVPNNPVPSDTGSIKLDTAPVAIVRVFEHISAHARFFQVMLGRNGFPTYTGQIRMYLEKIIRHRFEAIPDDAIQAKVPVDLIVSYVASAGLGTILWWLDHGLPHPPEQVALWFMQLIAWGPYYNLGLSAPPLPR